MDSRFRGNDEWWSVSVIFKCLIAGTAAIVIVNTGLYIKMEYHRKGVCEPRGPSLD